ncbi:MAG: IS4 family transposase [Rhizomicrobium sp.]
MRATAQRLEFIENHLDSLFASDLHAKRVSSLACGVLGVMTSASLAVSVIGQALAQARGKAGKHSIKQVDRLLSNQGIDVWALLPLWIKETVGARRELVIAMDWTDFDADDQTTLVFSLVTKHGRATPLLWFSLFKAELAGKRNDIEDMCLGRLKEALSDGTKVTILADRGFGDAKLFGFLAELGFAYVIRFRGDTFVTASDGETRRAEDWVGAGGRARKLADAEISKDKQKVGAVVCVKAKDMKEAWHLAASDGAATAREIINLYSRRWTIEPGFRDTKDLRFGMGLSAVRIGDPFRRDRMLLLNAIAIVLLTLLGGAGEALGMDRLLKSNTVKRRVHSLFRQGCLYYEAIPNMPGPTLCALIERFHALLTENKITAAVFAVI